MTRRRICKVNMHAFYMDDDGRIHEYRASSRTFDPSTGEAYIEDETGARKSLEEVLWDSMPGEFCRWRIKNWKCEAATAYKIFSTVPDNFVIDVM